MEAKACSIWTKTAPKQWQDHFAVILTELGGVRLKSDANVYHFPKSGNYLIVYVDDLVLMGSDPLSLFQLVAKKVLLKKTGELTDGAT